MEADIELPERSIWLGYIWILTYSNYEWQTKSQMLLP